MTPDHPDRAVAARAPAEPAAGHRALALIEAAHPFDRATALVRTGPGTFAGKLDPDWNGEGGAHGGMLSAQLVRAIQELTED